MLPDDDVVVGEVETDDVADAAPESPNPIQDFLNSVEGQDFVSAEKQFNDMVGDRLQNALDQLKVKIASSLYDDDAGVEVGPADDGVEHELDIGDEVTVDDIDDFEEILDDDPELLKNFFL